MYYLLKTKLETMSFYFTAAGDVVLFGAILGVGEGDRFRPREVVDGETGRF